MIDLVLILCVYIWHILFFFLFLFIQKYKWEYHQIWKYFWKKILSLSFISIIFIWIQFLILTSSEIIFTRWFIEEVLNFDKYNNSDNYYQSLWIINILLSLLLNFFSAKVMIVFYKRIEHWEAILWKIIKSTLLIILAIILPIIIMVMWFLIALWGIWCGWGPCPPVKIPLLFQILTIVTPFICIFSLYKAYKIISWKNQEKISEKNLPEIEKDLLYNQK